MKKSWLIACAFMICSSLVMAAEKPKVVATGLTNPSGIAIQPSTGDIFVSDSAGAGVVKIAGGKTEPVVTDFPKGTYGKGPVFAIGPLGLGFIGSDHLVVGGGGQADGSEVLSVYNVPKSGSIKADDTAITLGPIKPGEASVRGEGNFYGVAISKDAIYIASNGDDTKGWILRSEIKDGKPQELKPFIATKVDLEVDAPCGITIAPDGKLVIGQMGEVSDQPDSLLAVYDPKTGKKVFSAETGLNDLVSVAYSPKTGKLYGLDFAWADNSKGGLFELEVTGNKVTAKKITSLDKPTAMAFNKDGDLFVTVFNSVKDKTSTGEPVGEVLQFKGL